MTIADITLAAFTLCNSLRVVAYVPQIAKAAKDEGGAQAISFGTWGLFLVSHASAMAYALVNKQDWTMASMFLCNAVGCGVILLIAAWKRAHHRSPRIRSYQRPPTQAAAVNATVVADVVDTEPGPAITGSQSVVKLRRAA
jgi:hypothetical protein